MVHLVYTPSLGSAKRRRVWLVLLVAYRAMMRSRRLEASTWMSLLALISLRDICRTYTLSMSSLVFAMYRYYHQYYLYFYSVLCLSCCAYVVLYWYYSFRRLWVHTRCSWIWSFLQCMRVWLLWIWISCSCASFLLSVFVYPWRMCMLLLLWVWFLLVGRVVLMLLWVAGGGGVVAAFWSE